MTRGKLNFDLEVTDENGNRTRHAYSYMVPPSVVGGGFCRFNPDDVSMMLADQKPGNRIIGMLFGYDFAAMLQARHRRRELMREIGLGLIDHWLDAIEKEEGWTKDEG